MINRDGRGNYYGQHTFHLGGNSQITVSGRIAPQDLAWLHGKAKQIRALVDRVTTGGDSVDTAGWLDQAAQFSGMVKGALNTPLGKAAATVVPYGGIIKAAAEGAADGLGYLQQSGIAKDAATARRLAQLHDPRFASKAEAEVRNMKAKAGSGDPKAKAGLRMLRNAMFAHMRHELTEVRMENTELRQALREYEDPRGYSTGAEMTESRAALGLFANQALQQARSDPQPGFRTLPARMLHAGTGRR